MAGNGRSEPIFGVDGSLTAFDRDRIFDATQCSAAHRGRKQWNWEKGLTVSGPIEKLSVALTMAKDAMKANVGKPAAEPRPQPAPPQCSEARKEAATCRREANEFKPQTQRKEDATAKGNHSSGKGGTRREHTEGKNAAKGKGTQHCEQGWAWWDQSQWQYAAPEWQQWCAYERGRTDAWTQSAKYYAEQHRHFAQQERDSAKRGTKRESSSYSDRSDSDSSDSGNSNDEPGKKPKHGKDSGAAEDKQEMPKEAAEAAEASKHKKK